MCSVRPPDDIMKLLAAAKGFVMSPIGCLVEINTKHFYEQLAPWNLSQPFPTMR